MTAGCRSIRILVLDVAKTLAILLLVAQRADSFLQKNCKAARGTTINFRRASKRHPLSTTIHSPGQSPKIGGWALTRSNGEDRQTPTLVDMLLPPPSCDVDRMSSTDLAYIGDVVYELFVRSRSVWPPKRTSDLQTDVVGFVRAEFQSRLLAQLKEDVEFSEKERQVLSRGRNAVSGSARNRRDPAAYQDATALEALLGYLYIADSQRCAEIFQWMEAHMNSVE